MAIWSAEIKELEILTVALKGQFPELDKELGQLIRTDDANVIMLYSRRCLEVIITDLCECELKRPRKTEPLKGIIDKLNSEEKVPSFIIASMHGLNTLSTFGAHPKDFDHEQVKPVLVNLSIVLKWYLRYKGTKQAEKEQPSEDREKGVYYESPERSIPSKRLKKRSVITASGVLVTSIIVILIFDLFNITGKKLFKNIGDNDDRISVAVMPFQNMTNDTTWNVWQEGIQDNLITALSNSEELKIRQIESTSDLIKSNGITNYASLTPFAISDVSKKLDASVVVYGSISQAGSTVRVNAQLMDSQSGDVIKSFQTIGPYSEEMIFQIIDSLSRKVKNYLIISKLNKELSPDFRNSNVTNSPEAYRYFIQGQKAFNMHDYPTARKMFSNAVALDSNYTFATLMLSFAYGNQGFLDEAKKLCKTAYEKREQMPIGHKIHADWAHAYYFETPYEEIKYLNQMIEIDDLLPPLYYELGRIYNNFHQYDKSIPILKKALDIYDKWDSKPRWANNYLALGYAYHESGQYKKEKKLYKKAEENFPEDPWVSYWQAVSGLTLGDTITANKYLKKFRSLIEHNSTYVESEADVTTRLAFIYWWADKYDEAEKYFRKTLAMQPEHPSYLNNLAYFLIENDRNVDEGLTLINKALEIRPNRYIYLNNKGWALFKLGKYEESLEVMKKCEENSPIFNYDNYRHIQEVKKILSAQKSN